MAVIELDTGPAPAATTHPPVRLSRPAGLVAAVLLLFALGGAAPITPVMWRPLGSIPLATDGTVTMTGDRIVTISDGDLTRKVSVWQADGPRRLWTATTAMTEPGADVVVLSGARVVVAGDTVLVWRPDYRTAALDLNTGRLRFVARARVETAAPGVGVTRESVFRPGSEYDQQSGDAGPLYFAEDGRAYREPPLSSALIGVDLNDGRELWRLPLRGLGLTSAVRDGLLVLSADRIQVVDPATGRVLRERASGGAWADVFDDVVVVQEEQRTVGYDIATLTPRWTSPVRLLSDTITGARCDGVLCRRDRDAVKVIDPVTNTTVWQTGREVSLRREGAVVIEYDSLTQRPLRLNDARTGRTIEDLRGWQTVSVLTGGDPLLSRVEPGARRMSFAVVRAGRIQPLGYAGSIVRDCRAADGLAVCRTDESVELFAYR
ncbi:PQQ-binding-like beta-propeller repeat protein [Actinoplanes sp. NBRC 103695]|uniref:outer membrane protein assembly factor BamB family protein n=1 Tax=Actinoplanes sp. NBRC 103695 TaxID=3032202 RepID=UPI0024A27A45|nr:PQQ-binding-like beta-propeller repeat protein [Actinoplanes sp. NBRC 103695]GLY94827.1 hypothetical protein Acsp02_20820 [Actinoplanes sp. NBRC 103695]